MEEKNETASEIFYTNIPTFNVRDLTCGEGLVELSLRVAS